MLRRLTREQYENTVRDLLGLQTSVTVGFVPDDRVGPFASNSTVPVTELQLEKYRDAAEQLATSALSNLDALLPCDPEPDPSACAAEFVTTFGARAYRRPLHPEEAEALLDVYEHGAADGGFPEGIRLVIQAALQSPNFLYLLELGEPGDGPVVELDDYELASRLSYLLTNTMPDDELFALAAEGVLRDRDVLAAQALRLLDSERSTAALVSFHQQWLGLPKLEGAEKDPGYFEGFDEDLKGAMVDELARFVEYVFHEDDGRLETLLTAEYGFPTGRLFEVYGIDPSWAHEDGRVDFPEGQRSGLLTHAGVLAAFAHRNRTSPVHRGLLVRENLLCHEMPPPPPDVNNTLPEPDPDVSEQELLRQHRENPACAGCHNLIDPIGFTFEHYDGVGRWRDKDGKFEIDSTGELTGTDVDGPIDGVPDLAGRLAVSDDVKACVATQWFRFALGRKHDEELDACSHAVVADALESSDGDVRQMLVALVTSDAFRYRRAE